MYALEINGRLIVFSENEAEIDSISHCGFKKIEISEIELNRKISDNRIEYIKKLIKNN